VVDVLDADGLELVLPGIQAGTVLRRVRELVDQRRIGIAQHGLAVVVVVVGIQLGAQAGISGDRSPIADPKPRRTIEQVAAGGHAGADLVARAGALPDAFHSRDEVRRFYTGVDAAFDGGQRRGDGARVGGCFARDELGTRHQRQRRQGRGDQDH